jgi:hypothetical protein
MTPQSVQGLGFSRTRIEGFAVSRTASDMSSAMTDSIDKIVNDMSGERNG